LRGFATNPRAEEQSVIASQRSHGPPVGLSLHLPAFDGTPYLATRIEPEFFHVLLLPSEWPLYSQLNVAFRQAEANRLPTCFLLTPDSCLWLRTDGSVLPARAEPRDLAVAVGKLAPCEILPASAGMRERDASLRAHAARQGERTVWSDPQRGGWPPSEAEAETLAGEGEEGVPRGLERCPECGEWRGACLDPRAREAPLVLPVACPCDNDNECAACGALLFDRRLQSNWYDAEDRALHYVPGFHALDHVCG
jgi:hypothetical protein